MITHKIASKWLGNLAFESNLDGHKIITDADPAIGGGNTGARPKKLMLSALAGCTGIDVVMILKKMQVEIVDLTIYVEGEVTEEYPKYYRKMHVIYEFSGKDLPVERLERAVSLSEEKYCGVSAVYKKAMELTHEIRVINI
jgi:putative redox protein